MADLKREKITLKFNPYEAGQLNALQFSYLFGKSRFSELPNVNQVLKAMVLYTQFRTKEKKWLRKYCRNFLTRRNMPPQEFDKIIENDDELTTKGLKREFTLLPPSRTEFPQPGNFAFYTDEMDLDRLERIKERVAAHTSIPKENISNAELTRECIHFVFDDKLNDHFFRYITYVGALYNISPATSVIAGYLWRETKFPEEVVNEALLTSTKEEFITILKIESDYEVFQDFREDFKLHSKLNEADDINALFGEHRSKAGDFDFLFAFIGIELTFYTMRSKLTEIADAFIYLLINQDPELLEIGLDMFLDYLSIFTDLKEDLTEEGPPDYNKKIIEWLGLQN